MQKPIYYGYISNKKIIILIYANIYSLNNKKLAKQYKKKFYI